MLRHTPRQWEHPREGDVMLTVVHPQGTQRLRLPAGDPLPLYICVHYDATEGRAHCRPTETSGVYRYAGPCIEYDHRQPSGELT
jgi:hypothetical protein